MAGAVALAYRLFGQDVTASKTIEGVGKKAQGLGKAFGDMGKIAGGALAGIGLANLGSQAVQFGKDSMDAFANTGKEVLSLQRVAGGTAEEMSHLAAAAALTGTDTDVLSKSMGLLSKNIFTGATQLNDYQLKVADAARQHKTFKGNLGAVAQSFQQLGIDLVDAKGKTRSSADVLKDLAGVFSKMPNGTDKTALALRLFGRSGLAMLPILNKGKKGLEEMAAASDKAGTTLSGKDLEAVKANNKAKREFAETVKGLQIAIGRNLYPVITALMNYFRESVLPVIQTATKFFLDHQDVLLKVATVVALVAGGVKIFGTALSIANGVVKMFTIAQAALNLVLSLNPIGIVIIAIVALIAAIVLLWNKNETFRKIVLAVWAAIKTAISSVVSWVTETLWPKMKAVLQLLGGAFTAIGTTAKTVWDNVTTWFGKIVDFVTGLPGKIASAASGLWDGIKDSFRNAVNWLIDKWNGLSLTIGGQHIDLPFGKSFDIPSITLDTPDLPRLAAGGIVPKTPGGRTVVVGEGRYDEAIIPLTGKALGGTVVHHHWNVSVQGDTDPNAAARRIVKVVREAQRNGLLRPV